MPIGAHRVYATRQFDHVLTTLRRAGLAVASSFQIRKRKKPAQGEVIAVGPDGRDEAGKLIPIDIEPGTACFLENGLVPK